MQTKQLIVIRRDLKMRRGKEIAQGAHAAMMFLADKIDEDGDLRSPLTTVEWHWLHSGTTKITLQVPDLQTLFEVRSLAIENSIACHIVKDYGLTEFDGVETVTALAIGPEEREVLDPLFGHLKLY